MPRGGLRPGAGRKADPNSKRQQKAAGRAAKPVKAIAPVVEKAPTEPEPDLSDLTPLAYLLQVVRNPKAEDRTRIQAASIAAPYVHTKKGEGGKKDQQSAAAKKVAGRFAAAAPPRLAAAGGKKV